MNRLLQNRESNRQFCIGAKAPWGGSNYATIIIAVAQRISESVLQEDPKLLMWYDQAVTRMGGE